MCLYFYKKIGLTGLLLLSFIGLNGQTSSYFSTSTPEAQGVSSDAVITFIEQLESKIDAVHSFMMLRNGQLISQGWWDPYGPEIPHVMHSLSKSFTSTAIGFAVKEELLSLDDLVISFFPDKVPNDPSWQWKEMRVRDLLTMNTGHIEEPWGYGEEDWVKFFLKTEVPLMPGTVFKYNSMASYMLSAIIQQVTGEKLVDYLNPRLFQPLQIKKPEWDSCPMGITAGGWGLHILTEDIAKLGQFYLQKGKWDGSQLLSEEWVEMATTKQVSNGSNPANDWAQGYGFQFWRSRHNTYRGDGAMGQFCLVLPDQQAVIAITAGTNDMGGIMNIVWETLLPAMKNEFLPANDKASALLHEKIADLNLKPIEGSMTSPVAKKVSKRKYQMEANAMGVKSISFHLHGEHPSIDMEMQDTTQSLEIGTGYYRKREGDMSLPYSVNLEKKMAVSGAWVDDHNYVLRIYYYESPARMTYTFTFENDDLLWETKLDNALFGMKNLELLKGHLE